MFCVFEVFIQKKKKKKKNHGDQFPVFRMRYPLVCFLVFVMALVLVSYYLFVPCGKFGSPYLGKASSRKSSATHSYMCV